MSFAHLKPLVLEILQSPATDLESISAKRVRKALLEKQPDLDIKTYKAEIDAVIIEAFHEIAPPETEASRATSPAPPVNGAATAAPAVSKRKRSESPAIESDIEPSSPPFAIASTSSKPKQPPKVKAEPKALTDEELARQLHEQLNAAGRSTRRGTGYAPRSAGSKSKNKRTKSSQFVEDSDDEGGEHNGIDSEGYVASTKRPKRERDPNKVPTGGFHKEFVLSNELAAVVGAERMSRPQVIKQLWAYIKENELQDPKDKRKIICDDKLQAVFGVARTNGFKMNKPLQKHFYDIDE